MYSAQRQVYTDILKDDLAPAAGGSEPIAVAYAAALARELPGCMPDRMQLSVSRNILKRQKRGRAQHRRSAGACRECGGIVTKGMSGTDRH